MENELINEEVKRIPQEVQQQIKETRHKKELPLFIVCTVLGFLGIIWLFIRTALISESLQQLSVYAFMNGLSLELIGFLTMMVSMFSGFTILLIMIISAIISLYNYYGSELSYGVKVSENNFPEIYEKVEEYSRLLGLKKKPEVFVRQQNGIINAFSAWIPGKCFIQLNGEMVDIAYMENKDLETLYFVLAHEMAHIYLHHVQLYYVFLSKMAAMIPFIGNVILQPALQRSREYSADRVAQVLCEDRGSQECMMLLGVGRHAYRYMNSDHYLSEITRDLNPLERFFRWSINLVSSHPIMPFRVRAIIDPSRKSGRLF